MSNHEERDVLSRAVAESVLGSKESWIRRMFELAAVLRQDGGGPVYDLSLGNPSLEPPQLWRKKVAELVLDDTAVGQHRYTTNAGFPEVRAFIATRESKRYGLDFGLEQVTMTVGAAGAVNIFLRTVMNPGEEVISPAPYFAEYGHYCSNAGAHLVPAPTRADFTLDVDALLAAVTEKTRVIMLNSPNNPTGAIYPAEQLAALAAGLEKINKERKRSIYVLEDSPYRDLSYSGEEIPSMLKVYKQTAFATSHSKDLGLAGERIGYLLIHPEIASRDLLSRGLSFSNRTLGFVNAPALMQRVLPLVLDQAGGSVDVAEYAENARRMTEVLLELGFELERPRAGFFLFPKLPQHLRGCFEPEDAGNNADPDEGGDIALTNALRDARAIVVPGVAFGVPGYLRLALCVKPEVIDGAIAAFRKVCRAVAVPR